MVQIAFRVDASEVIGTGHYQRCIRLAESFREIGIESVFVSRFTLPFIETLLANKKFDLIKLLTPLTISPKHDSQATWLGTSIEIDAQECLKLLPNTIEYLIIDHYAIDASWEKIFKHKIKIFVLDDLSNRSHQAEVLINQNFFELDAYKNLCSENCQLLVGPEYAIISDIWLALRSNISNQVRETVKKITVFMGGIDHFNVTQKVLESIIDLNLSDSISLNVIIGIENKHIPIIEDLCKKQGYHLYVQPQNYPELINDSDIVIGAAGSAMLERVLLGIPNISIAIADNQNEVLKNAEKAGVTLAIYNLRNEVHLLKKYLIDLIANANVRNYFHITEKKSIDGLGIQRIRHKLFQHLIEVKRAEGMDCDTVFDWRNHPTVRENSSNSNPLKYNDHLSWYKNLLTNDDRQVLLKILFNKTIAGFVRFDLIDNRSATVSIFKNPYLNLLSGKDILELSHTYLFSHHSNIVEINATVLTNNQKSAKMFLNCKYTQLSTTKFLFRKKYADQ